MLQALQKKLWNSHEGRKEVRILRSIVKYYGRVSIYLPTYLESEKFVVDVASKVFSPVLLVDDWTKHIGVGEPYQYQDISRYSSFLFAGTNRAFTRRPAILPEDWRHGDVPPIGLVYASNLVLCRTIEAGRAYYSIFKQRPLWNEFTDRNNLIRDTSCRTVGYTGFYV